MFARFGWGTWRVWVVVRVAAGPEAAVSASVTAVTPQA